MANTKSILLLTKTLKSSPTNSFLTLLVNFLLQKDESLEIYVDERNKEISIHHDRLKRWTPKLLRKQPQLIHLILTFGGDGTVLYASWLFQKSSVPPVMPF